MVGSLFSQYRGFAQQASDLASTGDMMDPGNAFEVSRDLQTASTELTLASALFKVQLNAVQKITDRIG